jgi:glyceraldehyde 3-phosphate dehydrogenase
MAVKVGINGFGRIGRLAARILGPGHKDLELVAVNSRADSFTLAHLLKYDSVHRTFAGNVDYGDDWLEIEGRRVAVTRQTEPGDIPWKELGAEIVLESTGVFKRYDTTRPHLDAGAKKVIISAPSKDQTPMFVMGVNQDRYDPASMDIISNASCTTNCLAPVAKVINDSFGMEYGLMTTIHSYTVTQRLLDGSEKDIRRARAAALSMLPTSTGAARSLGQVIPELEGKLDGFAVRVPTPDVSLVDLNCRAGREVSVEEVNDALRAAADGPMKNILAVTDVPLVSVDYTSSPHSAVVDALLTMVMHGRMVKVLAWYDNEMGFAQRFVDLAALVARKM